MKHYRQLYPSRSRKTNIELIKNVLYADSQDAYDKALDKFVDSLHPSLFAELDWMEMSVPEGSRENAIKTTDGLFLNFIEKIIVSRQMEYEIDDVELFDEILENRDFYRFVLETAPEIANTFGAGLSERIKHLYQTTAGTQAFKNPGRYDYKIIQVKEKLALTKDKETLPLLMKELVSNEIAEALDHISSRMRAKAFIRGMGEKFPQFHIDEISNKSHVQELQKQLIFVHEKAKEFSLLSLQECIKAILQFIEETDVLSLNQYEGERATGYGSCAECSMMFSSSAIISLDTTCPFLFEQGSDRRYLPLEFNIARCPFCGAKRRIEAPSMFYWPDNKRVIYCTPLMGQYSEEEANDVHGRMISALRERYKSRISPVDAEAFDTAAEEITHSMANFIVAIQMGTTNKVSHAFNTITLADGSALLVDQTTKAIIELITPSEIHQMWELDENSMSHEVPMDQYTRGEELTNTAMTAYAEGDYNKAGEILTEQYKQDPQDHIVKQYLASVYLNMGKKETAAKILENK